MRPRAVPVIPGALPFGGTFTLLAAKTIPCGFVVRVVLRLQPRRRMIKSNALAALACLDCVLPLRETTDVQVAALDWQVGKAVHFLACDDVCPFWKNAAKPDSIRVGVHDLD